MITRPCVVKIGSRWLFICCVGQFLPQPEAVTYQASQGHPHPEWQAANDSARVHAHLFHGTEWPKIAPKGRHAA